MSRLATTLLGREVEAHPPVLRERRRLRQTRPVGENDEPLARRPQRSEPLHRPRDRRLADVQHDVPYGKIMATATLIAVPVLIFALIASKQLVRGLTMGAVK
jgi:hypothetical protein